MADPRRICVVRQFVEVWVEVPDDMTNEAFDKAMDSRYDEIELELDVGDAIQQRLTDVGAPLAGYAVQVRFV